MWITIYKKKKFIGKKKKKKKKKKLYLAFWKIVLR